ISKKLEYRNMKKEHVQSYLSFVKEKPKHPYDFHIFLAIKSQINLNKKYETIVLEISLFFSREVQDVEKNEKKEESIKHINNTRYIDSYCLIFMGTLLNKFGADLKVFKQYLYEAKKEHKYVQYGLHVVDCARALGLNDLIQKDVYDHMLEHQAKHNIHKLQFEQNVNEIVKILSREIWNLNLKPNDLILSGILDTEEIRERNPEFLRMLHDENMSNIFEEMIPRLSLPGKLSSFIRKYLSGKEMRIPDKYRSLYTSTRTFIDSIRSIWKKREYQNNSPRINESTWSHCAIDAIMKFIEADMEEVLFIRWDHAVSHTSANRNNADGDGPIKKADVFGTYYCENLRYNVELFFGEISGPPFYLNSSGKSHAIENQIKLGKCGKDSLEDFRRYCRKTKELVEFKNINVFLMHAHETIIKFSIMDQKLYPLFQIRTLEKVAFPYKCNSTFAQKFYRIDKDSEESNCKNDDSCSDEEESCGGEEEETEDEYHNKSEEISSDEEEDSAKGNSSDEEEEAVNLVWQLVAG
ncbi:11278_t:CDS:2, partial [Dentiscutata erythropus]